MSKKGFLLILIVASVSAFLGGFLSNRIYFSENVITKGSGKQQSVQSLEQKFLPEFKIVEANQFRLVDMEGKCLAKLTIEEVKDNFLDLPESTKSLKLSKTYNAVFEMKSVFGRNSMRMTGNEFVIMSGSNKARLASTGIIISDKSYITIYADRLLGTAINISDDKGNTRAVLGTVDLKVTDTGETRKRPESSLVLFGKDGKVIYKAP